MRQEEHRIVRNPNFGYGMESTPQPPNLDLNCIQTSERNRRMTRFLCRALADLEGGGVNEERERLFAYHHATKHSYQSVRTNAHYLDWHNQPDPVRTYEGAALITLPAEPGFPKAGTFATIAALAEGARAAKGSKSEYCKEVLFDVTWLSRLLWHSIAISAWKKVPQTGYRYGLRVNPSSGNLHPTETHLALLGFTGLDDGLYHYRADRHALELRSGGGWTEQIARPWCFPGRRSRR
jgi:hypothetical protein